MPLDINIMIALWGQHWRSELPSHSIINDNHAMRAGPSHARRNEQLKTETCFALFALLANSWTILLIASLRSRRIIISAIRSVTSLAGGCCPLTASHH
jgi:hypothetical protein